MLDLLGYQHTVRPAHRDEPTRLYAATEFLETGWNVHPRDRRRSPRQRFMHATMWPDRAAVMREWALEAAACA